MFRGAVENITKADIDFLIESEEPEGRDLDYKESINLGPDHDKSEFLADVCSFANAGGGYIVFGVAERRDKDRVTGIPDTAMGLEGNIDGLIVAMQESIRNGISPRVPVSLARIPGFPRGDAVVLHIARSAAAPHMVTFKGASRFYSRGFAQKFQMDVGQIRSAFLAQIDESEFRPSQ